MYLRYSLVKKTCVASTIFLGALLSCVACRVPRSRPQNTAHIDKILVLKSQHKLELLSHERVIKTYYVALGRAPGAKVKAGDHKTPVGLYRVDSKVVNSRFYKALHISYPNASDLARARALGVSPGGAIAIHGVPWYFGWLGRVQHRVDWTNGCIAVANSEMEEIWKMVPVGTPVDIRP